MGNLGKLLQDDNDFVAPVLFLLIFITSAVISGLIVLWTPGYLFWERNYKKSIDILAWTVSFSIIYFLIIFATLLVFSK